MKRLLKTSVESVPKSFRILEVKLTEQVQKSWHPVIN